MRAPGVSRTSRAHLVHHRGVQPLQQRHARVQRLLEVQLAAHRGRRHLGDLVLAAGVRGEQLDDLVLDERRVDVHDDQALRPAVQPGRHDRHVDADARAASVASAVRSGSVSTPDTANSTAVTGYLASRKIRSMLPPVAGDPGGDGGRGLGGQRVPEHGDVGTAAAARPVVAAAGDDLGLHLQRLGPAVDGGPQLALASPPAAAR